MQAMIPMDERDAHLEALAAQLHASGNYRVLRRLLPRTVVTAADGTPTRTGLFIDVETTGLDQPKDEVIEMAMVQFKSSIAGRLFAIHDAYQRFQEPDRKIVVSGTDLFGSVNHVGPR